MEGSELQHNVTRLSNLCTGSFHREIPRRCPPWFRLVKFENVSTSWLRDVYQPNLDALSRIDSAGHVGAHGSWWSLPRWVWGEKFDLDIWCWCQRGSQVCPPAGTKLHMDYYVQQLTYIIIMEGQTPWIPVQHYLNHTLLKEHDDIDYEMHTVQTMNSGRKMLNPGNCGTTKCSSW